MKTWEMIKELTENPEKEFTRKSDGLHIKTNEYGDLVWDSGYQFLRLHHDWEEVKKPVDFMDAVKALDEGKTIYVLHDGCYKDIFSPVGKQTDWGVAMEQEQGYAIDTEFILYGKWYIED